MKWGLVSMGLHRQYADVWKGYRLGNLEEQRDDAATRDRGNHRRATAFERTYGSAGGMNPGG